MQDERWNCPICDFREFDVDKFSATGGMLSKIFDVQTKKFTTVSCGQCGYTEIYKASTGTLGNIFDFFTG